MIIWVGTILTALMLFVAVMVGATTSYWFCADICHAVQDDSISSYERSAHSEVSCVSCHMPVGANPVVFLLHKVKALGELPPTIANTFEIPLNPADHVAMNPEEMPDLICTQCHNLKNRIVTPSEGMIISHAAHEDQHITCTACHNRTAHDESGDWKAVNKDPKTGQLNVGHRDFMEMSACYRCHRLEDDGIAVASPYKNASGECEVCHLPTFELKPENHLAADFKEQHGKLAEEEEKRVEEAEVAHEEYEKENPHTKAKAGDLEARALENVPDSRLINECYTCHTKQSCEECHGGVEMPHAANYTSIHREEAEAHPTACANCHGGNSCTECHHSDPNVAGYTFVQGKSWMSQHDEAANQTGAAGCFECHKPTDCARCHVSGKGIGE
jgi:hypothetical protein